MHRWKLRIPKLAAALTLGLLAAVGLASASPGAEASDALTGVVNVNTATVEQLVQLPGIGEVKARAIVAAREKRGGFERADDLLEVRGIGEAALERIRRFVVVSGRTTLRMP